MNIITITSIIIDQIRTNYIVIFEIIGIISALLALTTNNPIVCLGFFINLICNSAFFLVGHGIGFLGFTYILIYVGAIAILFLFIIMLLNVKSIDFMSVPELNEELNEDNSTTILGYNIRIRFTNYILIVGIFVSIFYYIIFKIINPIPTTLNEYSNITNIFYNDNLFSLAVDTYNTNISIIELSDITIIGNLLYSDYSILFIIIGFMLLLSIMAAIYLVSL